MPKELPINPRLSIIKAPKEKKMSLFQMFSAFEKYSFDVLTLALAVVVITSFIKRVIFKNKLKKVITFVPFILGVALFIAYQYAITKTAPTKLATSENIKSGIITGGLGTVYYVFYEQFIRTKKLPNLDVPFLTVTGILAAIVIKEKLDDTALEVVQKTKGKLHDKSYCMYAINDALSGKLVSGVSGQDIINYSKLIITALSVL